MTGNEICKALGIDPDSITKLEMTFTAQEATVVATFVHLDTDRPAGTRLIETLRTFELVERLAPSGPSPVDHGVVVERPDGVEVYRVSTLAEHGAMSEDERGRRVDRKPEQRR